MSLGRLLLRVEGLTMDMDPSSPDQEMQVNTLKGTHLNAPPPTSLFRVKGTGDVIFSDTQLDMEKKINC